MGQIRDFFLDQISVHFGSASQNVLKSDLKKSPGFIPFWANLTHFGAESEIPEEEKIEMQGGDAIQSNVWFIVLHFYSLCLVLNR